MSDCTKDNCTYDLDQLEAFTEYSVSVVPNGIRATELMSDPVKQFTAEAKPNRSPGQVSCKAISSTEIQVSWWNVPSESLRGILKGYKVTYAESNGFRNELNTEYTITLANQTVLRGLQVNTAYAIKVLASNSAGDGVESKPVLCSTDEDGIIICNFNSMKFVHRYS